MSQVSTFSYIKAKREINTRRGTRSREDKSSLRSPSCLFDKISHEILSKRQLGGCLFDKISFLMKS